MQHKKRQLSEFSKKEKVVNFFCPSQIQQTEEKGKKCLSPTSFTSLLSEKKKSQLNENTCH